jgi:RHS repeat-associated protein
VGIRSASLGYSADSVRQKFGSYERENETGLDFAQARYFSSVQGRFTSVDPMLESAELGEPQSWNRYSFVLNNPLVYTDPTGEKWAVQYSNGKATFRWYDGDTIPTDWEGKWEEYKSSWFFGEDVIIRLGRAADDVYILTKQVFDEAYPGGWAKLQGADPANFTDEQKNIIAAAITWMGGATPYGQAMKEMWEMFGASMGGIRIPVRPVAAIKPAATAKSLPPSVQRKLGGLASRANEKVADVIRSRGGNASNVKETGHWAEKTLAETAQAAINGEATAVKAIKVAKDAGRLGKKY